MQKKKIVAVILSQKIFKEYIKNLLNKSDIQI